jgi:hypothetical protein
MTQELYGYVGLGIWLTMVAVAAAGLWPRKSDPTARVNIAAGPAAGPKPTALTERGNEHS